MSRFWKAHRHTVPPKGELKLSGEGLAKVPTDEVFKIKKSEVDYVKEYENWPKITEYDETINEFEWEGFGSMFLGLTIVNMYDNRGIVVKRVDPDGAGGQFGVEAGDYFVGIGGRAIPTNLPDGEVAKVFHSLSMPIKLAFARIPPVSATELFDWSSTGQLAGGSTSPGSRGVMSPRAKQIENLPKFVEGDAVTFYRGSSAYHGNVQTVHGVGLSALCDILLPASNSLVQGVPTGRLSYRDEAVTSPSDPISFRDPAQNLTRQKSRDKMSSSTINSPNHSAPIGRGGTQPVFLRQPSGTAATAASSRAAQAAMNVKAKTKSPSPKYLDSFNPFDDFPTSSKTTTTSATAPIDHFDPFAEPSTNNEAKNRSFDLFETCTEDAETTSQGSYDFNKESSTSTTSQNPQGAPPPFQSSKLSRGFSRSLSNSGGFPKSPGALPRSPSGVGANKPEFPRSPSGLSRGFSRSDSGPLSPGKTLFLNAFEKTDDFPASISSPSSKPSKYFVKGNDGNLQAQVAGFNPFD